jgi:hypothetical protein
LLFSGGLLATLGIVMFMILGAVFLIALLGSALLGVVTLLAAVVLIMNRALRRVGTIILCSGLVGAALGLLALFMLHWALNTESPAEMWLLFGAAGFGWAALFSAIVLVLIAWLRQPTRWVERKRNANA